MPLGVIFAYGKRDVSHEILRHDVSFTFLNQRDKLIRKHYMKKFFCFEILFDIEFLMC